MSMMAVRPPSSAVVIPVSITEDASAPAVVHTAGVANLTTASFSPPAASLVVAISIGGWHSSGTPSAVHTDSKGSAYTVAFAQTGDPTTSGGYIRISFHYFATAPGAMTVTSTNAVAGAWSLQVLVLNGAAVTQNGATAGAQFLDTTVFTRSITTTAARSRVYGAVDDSRSTNTLTAAANTTLTSADWTETTVDLVSQVFIKASAATVTPGAVTLGVNDSSSAARGVIALWEVLAA